MKIGAFANNEKKNLESKLIIPNAPFSKLFIEKLPSNRDSITESNGENTDCETHNNKLNEDENKNGNSTPKIPSPVDSRTTRLTMVPTNDDFIMVDLVNFSCKKLHALVFGIIHLSLFSYLKKYS